MQGFAARHARVLAAATLLGVFALALPVQLQRHADGSSDDECLTLADHPPTTDATTRLALLESCHGVVPDDPVLLADLGAAYEAAGRGDDATRSYRQALTLDPNDGDLHLRLAAHLLARGATADARLHAEAALRLQPNRPAVLRLLARLSQPEAAARP